jgi:hypothetical protein
MEMANTIQKKEEGVLTLVVTLIFLNTKNLLGRSLGCWLAVSFNYA